MQDSESVQNSQPNAGGAVPWDQPVDSDYHHASPEAYERFQDWKFGLRIHFYLGLQIGARLGSWWLYEHESSLHQQYYDLCKTFNPTEFNADQWSDLLVAGGCKYYTFVTKHHDGFCPWDTRTRVTRRYRFTGPGAPLIEPCDLAYSVMDTPFKRDIVREIVDATRPRGLGVGLYFSHWDWYDADFRWSGIGHVPYDPGFARKSDPEGYARFLARYTRQIRELLSDFGKVDVLEFDCEPRGTYEAFRQRQIEDWKLIWPDIKPVIKMARRLQPDVLFRERGIGAYGDFHTPEWQVPDEPNPPCESQHVRLWQVIYPVFDEPAEWILKTLIDVVAKGGNLQIGFLPLPSGRFSDSQVQRLRYVGDWLKVNGEAIYATRRRPGPDWKEGDDVRFTRSKDGRTVYAICLKWPGKQLTLRSLVAASGSKLHLLGCATPLPWQQDAQGLTIQLPEAIQAEQARPCRQAYAIRVPVASADAHG